MKKVLQIMILLVSVFVLVACGDKTPDLTIDAPKNVEINGDVLSWSAVSDADSYLVYIDTRSVEVDGTSFNLANEPMTVGEHMISVVAVKGDGFSIPSAVLTYTVAILANPANIASSVITSIDPTYETGMDQSDFPNEWEYEDYLDTLAIVEAYAQATANVRMTEANAIGFFNDFQDMTSSDIQTLGALMDEMEMFDTYNMTPYATAYVLYSVALVGMDEEMDQDVIDAFEDNEELVVQSLEMVLDFLMTVKNSIPANVITTIDGAIANEEITNAEIFLIKDEMITILQANLPSVNDFTILYTTLFHVGGAITGEDMTSYVAHASYLAEVNHLEFELVLSMLDAITLVNMNEIEALVNEMNVEVYEPEWDYYYTETDPKKAVELILYIATFIDDFKTANTTMFDELDALMQDDSAEALYGIAIDNVIAQVQADVNIPALEKADIIAMLNEFKGEYDTIMAAQAIIKEIGLGVFEEFVDTEASLILNILSLNDAEDLTQAEITALVNSIIDDAISLNGIVMNELDQAAFQTLLDFIKIPLMLQLPAMGMMMDMEEIDYETIYDALSPFIAELLANAVVLEKAVVNALDTVDVASLFEDSMGMSMILSPVLDVLNTALTPANEALIMDSVDIIFDNILKQADLLDLTEMTIAQVDEMKGLVVDQVEFFIDEIQTISTWDLENLTTEQQERVEALMVALEEIFGSGDDEGEYNPDPTNARPVYAGQTVDLTIGAYQDMYFIFQPVVTGYYDIYSIVPDGSVDPAMNILTADYDLIGVADDEGSFYNFYVDDFYFIAGVEYYLVVYTYESYTTSFSFVISNPS